MQKIALALTIGLYAGSVFAVTGEVPAGSGTGFGKTSTVTAVTTGAAGANTTQSNASATVSSTCRDGTTFVGESKKGACSGHKGVKTWGGTTMTGQDADTKAAAKSDPTAMAQKPSSPQATAAAGGGAGKVWVNPKSNTYHCQNDRFYGKTKTGAYMTEADAKANGAHADHGKSCA